MKTITALVIMIALTTGCTWVKLTPEGEKVRVLSAAEVVSCKKLGRTTVSLKATVAGFERNVDKVKKELEMLARNRAMDLGGDTVVATSKVVKGQQTFAIYRCVNP